MRALLLLPLLATPALASSDEAWREFAAEVRAACTALAAPIGTPVVEVSPSGSESYGAALVTIAVEGGVERSICIFDKRNKTAELAAPFAGN